MRRTASRVLFERRGREGLLHPHPGRGGRLHPGRNGEAASRESPGGPCPAPRRPEREVRLQGHAALGGAAGATSISTPWWPRGSWRATRAPTAWTGWRRSASAIRTKPYAELVGKDQTLRPAPHPAGDRLLGRGRGSHPPHVRPALPGTWTPRGWPGCSATSRCRSLEVLAEMELTGIRILSRRAGLVRQGAGVRPSRSWSRRSTRCAGAASTSIPQSSSRRSSSPGGSSRR